jgi:ribosome hibernation promoting factor
MNLSIVGHQLEVTSAIRGHVSGKMERIKRHFDHVLDLHVTLSTSKLGQKAEVTLHVPGKEIHCACEQQDLYAAIDLLVDKLDRQVLKYKDQHSGRPHGVASKHDAA